MAHIIEQANIDYSVQGLRGGEPHNKKNVGNVTLQLDRNVTIQAEAFKANEDKQTRERRDQTLLTIKKGEKVIFSDTPLMLCDIMAEYYGIKPTDQ